MVEVIDSRRTVRPHGQFVFDRRYGRVRAVRGLHPDVGVCECRTKSVGEYLVR
jgi:hypothetical protein